ncbi:MAG: hypothetical protein HON53_18630 [Planctomycetaceae bacterium]|nr:hypothetical protein [Planctomycetaceae bacterium]
MKWLELNNTRVTDGGLEHLNGLTNLRFLALKHTRVTEEGVKELKAALPQCEIQWK